jgi:hypothetical protein
VTHPFHPLFGREFELMTQKNAWGEDRVYFRDKSKHLHYIPLGWTSVAPVDAFKVAAAGQCRFRTEDLLRMADLVDSLAASARQARKDNYAASVNIKTPAGAAETQAARGIYAPECGVNSQGKQLCRP